MFLEGKGVVDDIRFNPTLVRLRQRSATSHPQARAGFNPTLVRLRQRYVAFEERVCQRFNPTLVRLRHISGL